jgi:UDP-N-acetylmuramoyl-tripeptide--D-alanyl-D-alanine ligase
MNTPPLPTMQWSLRDAASDLGATFTGTDAAIVRVSTDSRDVQPGDLFVALKGARFDGGVFAEQALADGAVGVVLDAEQAPGVRSQALRVADTRIALGQLGAAWRARFHIPVAAITGSNGKTTVKEMLAAILVCETGDAQAVLATLGNLNNDIGVPQMLLRLRPQHRFAVFEMGMNHAGELDYLSRLVRPHVALVNNALAAHIGFFGSVEAIARAKGEIFNGLAAHAGTALINLDDPHAALWQAQNTERVRLGFGFHPDAQIHGAWTPTASGGALHVRLPDGELDVSLKVPGEHNAKNALAAIALAFAMDVSHASIVCGLAGFTGVAGRLQSAPGLAGSTFLDDTYNANPDSVKAALAVLGARPGKKILVLGEMGELGDLAEGLHADIGLAARAAGVDRLLGLGDLTALTVQAFGAGGMHFARIEELLAELENALDADTTVLVKGSRFMKMERVVSAFTHDL